jgi:hypothetical protein
VNPSLSGYYFVNGVLEFMNNSDCDVKYWNEFLRTTAWHDDYRKQNFKETFNEFYKIVKENGYDISMEK